MGVIQIRRSGAQLGNLPNVRMVDTSGLATSSSRGIETLGEGLTKGVLGTMKGVSEIAEWKLKMQEKENAMITSEKLVKADEYLQTRLYDPNEGILQKFEKDEDEVPGYLHDPQALQQNILQEVRNVIGYDKLTRPSQRRLLDVKLQSALAQVNRTLNTTASNIMDQRSRRASERNLERAKTLYTREPSEENLAELQLYFDEYANAHNFTSEERVTMKEELKMGCALQIAENNIAMATTPEAVQHLQASLHENGAALFGPMHEAMGHMQQADVKKLHDTLQKSIDAHTDALAKESAKMQAMLAERREQSIAELEMAMNEGSMSSHGLDKALQQARESGYPVSDILKIQKLHRTQLTKEGNEYIALVEATDPSARQALLDKMPESLAQQPEMILRLKKIVDAGVEEERKLFQMGVDAQVEQLIYGNNEMGYLPIAEREKMIRSYVTNGMLSPEAGDKAVKALKAVSSSRISEYANTYAAEVGLITATLAFTKDATGETVVDTAGTLSRVYSRFGTSAAKADKDEAANAVALTDALKNAWREFSSWCEQNPKASEKETEDTFKKCFFGYHYLSQKYSLDKLSRENLKTADDFYRAVRNMNILGARNPYNTYKVSEQGGVEVTPRQMGKPTAQSQQAEEKKPSADQQ